MTSNNEECAANSSLNRDAVEDTNGWTTHTIKRTRSGNKSHSKSSAYHVKETSDGKSFKGYSGKHSKGKSNVPTQEYRTERAAKEKSQDLVRQHKRISYTLKQSNVKGGQTFVDSCMRDFSDDVLDASGTVAKIVKHCKNKALEACKRKLSENDIPGDQLEMFNELLLEDRPIREYCDILNTRVSDETITQECANALTTLFANNKATEECAKVLDELMRYHRADIIGHPDIVELINNTRAQDGYTYYHWLVFPSRTSSDTFNKDEFIRCIRILHNCGCSPFAKNLKDETCIDAMFYSVRNNKTIPSNFSTEIYLEMLNPPALVRRNMLVNCLNKITLDKADQFASLLCWSVHIDVNELIHDFVSRCLKVSGSSKINGHYKSIDELHEIIMCVLKMGPQGNHNNLKAYFDIHPWDGLDAVSKFFHGVLDYVKSISDEPLDIDLHNKESLGVVLTEKDLHGNTVLKLNPLTTCADALGAIVGEIGDIPHINEYVEAELAAGNIMNAVTCIAHSGRFTQSIATSIVQRIDGFVPKDKVFIELAVNRVIKATIPCESYQMLQFNDKGSLIRESISVASSPARSSVSGEIAASDLDDDSYGSIYVPPFNANESDKFGLFSGFGTIKVQDIVTKPNGEVVPSCVDDAVYSLGKKLAGKIEVSVMVSLFAKIIDSTKGSEIEVAKFVVDCCKISKTTVNNALKQIADIPHEEIDSCFDNTQALENIKRLLKLYKFVEQPVTKSPATSTGQYAAFLQEDNDVVVEYESDTPRVIVTAHSASGTSSPSTNSVDSKTKSKKNKKNKK